MDAVVNSQAASVMQAAQPKPDKSKCHCGWGDCLGLCSFIEPLDEDVLKRQVASTEDSPGASRCFQEESPTADEVLAIVNKGTEFDELDEALKTSGLLLEGQSDKSDESSSPIQDKRLEDTPTTFTERKRKKERKRRNDITQGLDALAKVIFLVDPQLEAQARKNHHGGDLSAAATSTVEGSKLLGRVELVNAAVDTLARVHNDNEVHKLLIAHLTGGERNEEDQPASDAEQLLATTKVSSFSTSSEDATEEGQLEDEHMSQSERKRNREKKRRSDIAKGMSALADMLFRIDPTVKAAAEERAKKIHAGGSTSTATKQPQLLSRVELVNCAAVVMSRIHKENEIHKMIIRTLAANTSRGVSPESLPSVSEEESTTVLSGVEADASSNVSDEVAEATESTEPPSSELDDDKVKEPQASSSAAATEDQRFLSSLLDSVELPTPVSFNSVADILSSTEEQAPPSKRVKV